jgi:hypothetical protein
MTFFLPSSHRETAIHLSPNLVEAPTWWRCQHGGGERDRTDDLLLAKQALSQLSYTPVPVRHQARETPGETSGLVGQGGFEPPTSRLSSARSNQLSY